MKTKRPELVRLVVRSFSRDTVCSDSELWRMSHQLLTFPQIRYVGYPLGRYSRVVLKLSKTDVLELSRVSLDCNLDVNAYVYTVPVQIALNV